jgi:uncharacterized membrane-anchored protein
VALLNPGYTAGSLSFLVLFAISLIAQMESDPFHPLMFSSVILTARIVGASMSNFTNRSAGLGYAEAQQC